MDAVTALRTYLSNLPEDKQAEFSKKTGFNLNNLYLMNMKTAKEFCESYGIDLTSESAWTKYNKAKADWNTHHPQYLQARGQYIDLKDQLAKAEYKYNKLIEQFMEQNDTNVISQSDENEIRDESKYTTDNIKGVRSAELGADALLAKCFTDVDAQRAGLNFGTMMNGFI